MPYDERYESDQIRGIEEARPWNITQEIKKWTHPNFRLLDVGCGTAFKVLPIAPLIKELVGLDPNPAMRQRAMENIRQAGVTNMILVEGVSEKLPFEDESFDLVTCLVAHQSPREFHRVLKPGGTVICEQFGEQDKRRIADCFEPDDQGPRGIFSRYQKGELLEEHRKKYSHFSQLSLRIGTWNAYLTYEGLLMLLGQVPLVRGFDPVKDESSLKRIKETLTTEKGIHVFHERVLIEASK